VFPEESDMVILMEIKKLTIFTATQKSNIEDTTLYKSIQELEIDAEVKIQCIENNKEPLAVVYNQAMKNALEDEADALIIIHDDVWLEHDPVPNLRRLFDQYDLIGVAGASRIQLESPALWHLMGGGFNKGHLHGRVAHGTPKDNHITDFGPYPHRVVVIDGVFMAMKPILMENIEFDDECPSHYHFYDIIMSQIAHNLGFSVGVGDISIIHESRGLKNFTNEWKSGEDYYLKWYGN
jgi:GT2 family glycosyltransferase